MKPPNPVRLLAEIRGDSIRTARRLFESGQVPGAYRTRSRWRIQRLGKYDVDAVINLRNAVILSAIKKQFFPHFDEVIELILVSAGVTNDDIVALKHPDPEVRRRKQEELKEFFPEKWRVLCCPIELPNFGELSQRFKDPQKGPRIRLLIGARKLRLHGHEPTPGNLAAILGISIKTLYQRYDRELIRSLRYSYPVRDEVLLKDRSTVY